MAGGERKWRKTILRKLEVRDRVESHYFKDIIREHNKLFEYADTSKSRVVQLEIQVVQLQQEKLELQGRVQELSSTGGGGGGGSGNGSEKIASLEQKLFKLQEELTELHRQKGENAQKLMELNNVLREKEHELSVKEGQFQDLTIDKEGVDKECTHLQQKIIELDATCQMVKDELQALQLAYTALEAKHRRVQEENQELITRWMAQKAKAADEINAQNENQLRLRQQKLLKDLSEAAKEPVNINCDHDTPMIPSCVIVSIPSYPDKKIDAHDGEVNAARFSLSGKFFATGGADRRVKIWEQVNGNYTTKGIFHGSNSGVLSVQFDPQEKLILASSHDGACRVWTLSDQRLRHTLTGHSQKVMSAKFYGGATKVVSGAHDRTLKIWDLRSKQCTRTIFAGSSCNDIAINERISSQVASGHLDRTVRFWDVRTANQSSVAEITLQGKITSLDLSQDMNYMLASARDDTVKLLDLRMNQVMLTCSADGFKVAMDHTRASFSPDSQYVICGSQDGSIFIWDASTAKLEKILKEHNSSVVVCTWHPDGSSIISCDRNKRAILWTNKY